jgi:hypothetical protein
MLNIQFVNKKLCASIHAEAGAHPISKRKKQLSIAGSGLSSTTANVSNLWKAL